MNSIQSFFHAYGYHYSPKGRVLDPTLHNCSVVFGYFIGTCFGIAHCKEGRDEFQDGNKAYGAALFIRGIFEVPPFLGLIWLAIDIVISLARLLVATLSLAWEFGGYLKERAFS